MDPDARPTLGLVTSEELALGIDDDQPLVKALHARGIDARFTVWSDPCADWTAFDALLVRTTWDYYEDPARFRQWVDRVEEAGVPLWNPPDVLRWNTDKRYLRDLEKRGVPVVPTRWIEPGEPWDLEAIMDEEGWTEAVVKPAVSAGAYRTWRIPRDRVDAHRADVDALARERPVMVQPFLPVFQEVGEWSFLFFDDAFSHAVLKRPKAGDFRVQPQWGGTNEAQAPPPERVQEVRRVLDALDEAPLYARVDGVHLDGVFHLVELELIEPRLFLLYDEHAAGRLADALLRRLSPAQDAGNA